METTLKPFPLEYYKKVAEKYDPSVNYTLVFISLIYWKEKELKERLENGKTTRNLEK